jgi:hypothetical protein
MVAWESLLECDAIHLLEFSGGVVSYQEQPTVIQYFDGHQMRDYYPDFELVLEDGSLVHLEVKPSSQLAKPKVEAKLRAIATHYRLQGRDFRIVTEREIRREPLLSNVRKLSYLSGRIGHTLPTIAELARKFGLAPLHFCQVGAELGDDVALRLVAIGRLECDLAQPLKADAFVSVTKGGHHAAVLL